MPEDTTADALLDILESDPDLDPDLDDSLLDDIGREMIVKAAGAFAAVIVTISAKAAWKKGLKIYKARKEMADEERQRIIDELKENPEAE